MKRIHKQAYEDVDFFSFGYHPIGKPTYSVYIYYVDGLLIDTGQRWMRKHILGTLGHLAVDQIFITHHHEDHTGNIDVLQNHFNCPVFASDLCCEMMKHPPRISLAQYSVWGPRPAYHDLVAVRDHVQTPNYTFSIHPIPGHAPDMVALYEPERKWLFSSDLFINSYIGYFLRDESIGQQIQSIKNILMLDFEVMFCAHNPRLNDGRQKLMDKLHFLEEFYEKVKILYDQGLAADGICRTLKLREHGLIHVLSHGLLSGKNMVRSAIRDYCLEGLQPQKSG